MRTINSSLLIKLSLVAFGVCVSAYQIQSAANSQIAPPPKAHITNQQITGITSLPSGRLFGGDGVKSAHSAPRLRLYITGLLPDSNGSDGAAFLKVAGGAEELYSIGDSLSPDAVLVSIDSNSITVDNKGDLQHYPFSQAQLATNDTPLSFNDAAVQAVAPMPAPMTNEVNAAPQRQSTVEVSRLKVIRQFAPKVTQYMNSTPKKVMSDLDVSSNNGSYVIGANSPLSSFGLRENDQVVSINGKDVKAFIADRPSIKDVMSKPMELGIIRNQQRQNLTLKLN